MKNLNGYNLMEVLSNYTDISQYNNSDEAFNAFINDYDEELRELEGDFDRFNIESEASCYLNDYYSSFENI